MSRRFLVALGAMAVLFSLLVAGSVRLIISEAELAESITEDMVWLSSQGQYEAVRLADALQGYRLKEVSREDLKLRLDLLVSRIAVLDDGEPRRLMEALGHADRLPEYRAVVSEAADLLRTLEPDRGETIQILRRKALVIAQSMRDVANAALLARRDRDAMRRDQRRQSLFELLGTLVATMGASLLLAGVLIRDHRKMVNAEAALERERQISKLHRTFISVVSHQFRTPLAIIDASAQRMIRRGAAMAQEEVAARAEKIRNACLRLTRLMESTLNAARLEEGEISFTLRACNLVGLLRTVIGGQQDEDQQRIRLDSCNVPEWIEADTTLLEQAIQNLVSNALKYSADGSPVEVRAQRLGKEIRISVADQGVGIPADEIGSLFRRFFRARTAEGISGTGIGLSFVAQIMTLHKGHVEVKSVEGQGSTFTLVLPYREPGPDSVPLPKLAEVTG
jgi:signal transduction histidine kinase